MSPNTLKTDPVSHTLGPFDPVLPGPIRIHFSVDGERIVESRIESGYAHRGLEKAMELHRWIAIFPYLDRLDPEAAIFGELVVCLAVEQICSINPGSRVEHVRLLVSELTRVSTHMGFLARIAQAVGAQTFLHHVLRDREKVLDLFELLSGSRFAPNYLRFGGLSRDVSEGFLERTIEVSGQLLARLEEYSKLLFENDAFIRRTKGIGILSLDRTREFGITGPNARAAGRAFDVRKAHPYSGSGPIFESQPPHNPSVGQDGDALSRVLYRAAELKQSLNIIREMADAVPEGVLASVRLDEDLHVPSGEAFVRVESPRGLLGCYVASDGGAHPHRIQFCTPTQATLAALEPLLEGERLQDLGVILASFDLSVAEADK